MLQQTTVAAVIPYFERFIERYPTVQHLAAAEEQEVLHLWQGLGYYRRARHLHAAAKQLAVHESLPKDSETWRKLPGVGRYILGAVLSQAFDARWPIIEANSLRVLCRLYGEKRDPKSSAVQAWIWKAAEELLPRKRVGDFNQAMMELGALVCTPTRPSCRQCPLRSQCQAYRDGTQERIPTKAMRAKLKLVDEVAVVIRHQDKFLVTQRPADASRWANMWEFPQSELKAGETHEQAARRWTNAAIGLRVAIGNEIATIRYGVTRFRMTLVALEARAAGERFQLRSYAAGVWIKPAKFAEYPMSTAQRQLAKEVARTARQLRLF